MGSIYEVEVTIDSGKNLKNVNWKNGDLRPYAVVWVDPSAKVTTKVDIDNNDDPIWDEKLVVPLRGYDRHSAIEDAVLYIDVVHAKNDEEVDVKPLVGSARLPLLEIVDEAGVGGKVIRTLKLKRPSGRPHGKIEVKVCVREPSRYYDPHPPPAAYGMPYGAGPYRHHESADRGYDGSYGYNQPPPPVGYPYGEPPHTGYPYGAPPPTEYPYGGPPPNMSPYGGEMAPPHTEEKKKSKFGGMGTGLAVGAVVGVAGGFALAEGLDHFKDDVAEDVEEDLGDDDDE